MAHNLNETNGKISFASANGQVAWHGLGQVVNHAMTAKEAIELAQLDYKVIKSPLTTCVNDQELIVSEKFATVRTDTNSVLGIVGSKYEIVQNQDAFIFFDSIIGDDHAIYETAGCLGNGSQVFISARMPEFIRIAGTNDVTETFVVLTSSHDGTGAINCFITNVRLVCQNTMRLGLRTTKNKVTIRHTKNYNKALEQAHHLLGITHAYTKELNECLNHIAKKKITDTQVKQMIEQVYVGGNEDGTRLKNIRDNVFRSYQEGIGQESVIGNSFGALQGITYFESHVRAYKNQDVKFNNVLNGTGNKITNDALNYLLAL